MHRPFDFDSIREEGQEEKEDRKCISILFDSLTLFMCTAPADNEGPTEILIIVFVLVVLCLVLLPRVNEKERQTEIEGEKKYEKAVNCCATRATANCREKLRPASRCFTLLHVVFPVGADRFVVEAKIDSKDPRRD